MRIKGRRSSLPAFLCDDMWSNDADKLAGCYDLCLLPEYREVLLVAGNEVVSASGVGAFKKDVIVRIIGDMEPSGGRNEAGAVFDKGEKLLLETLSDSQFRA